MCRRDLQCLLTSKVFDAIVCGEEEERMVVVVVVMMVILRREERRAGCFSKGWP